LVAARLKVRHSIYDPDVPDLILLNGPPASGKSTLARRYVDAHPLSLNLDVDVLRGLLGGWADDPEASGLVARSFALSMAEQHLIAGHDVVVPQFLGRSRFIDQLGEVAAQAGARFVEVALWLDRPTAIAAFTERTAAPTTQSHVDAADLVERSPRPDPLGSMYDELVAMVDARPQTVRVDVARGDIGLTFQHLCEALT